MFDAVGHPVIRLRRIRIGPIEDPALKVGYWRELSPREVAKLRTASQSAKPQKRREIDSRYSCSRLSAASGSSRAARRAGR